MIAILGATGYIGGALARVLAVRDEPLSLFARDLPKLKASNWPSDVTLSDIDTFSGEKFSLVINAIGAGDPGRVRKLGGDILDISDRWDRRVLDTMNRDTRYVFLSSGAIYGACSIAPDAQAVLALPVNQLGDVPPYTMAKLVAEMRHRSLTQRAILDLRVFSFADANIDRSGQFFLAELARSVAEELPFATAPGDFLRDYVGAEDLWGLIECWRKAGAPNGAFDAYSKAPVSKRVLLDAARARFGLTVQTMSHDESPTGVKPVYASGFRAAGALGYQPDATSLQTVIAVLDVVAATRPASGPKKVSGARR